MGKKKTGTAVVPATEAEADAPAKGKYRITHSQNGESVELSFHDADRRDGHAQHLRSTGVHNVETFDAPDDAEESAEAAED